MVPAVVARWSETKRELDPDQVKPTYYSVLMARSNAPFNTLDEAIAQSQKGEKLKLSLADVGCV